MTVRQPLVKTTSSCLRFATTDCSRVYIYWMKEKRLYMADRKEICFLCGKSRSEIEKLLWVSLVM